MKNNIVKVEFDEMTSDDISNVDTDWNVSDGLEYVDFLIENFKENPESIEIPTEYIDQVVLDEDYMEFDNYLSNIPQTMIDKVMEHVEFNYPDFFEDVKIASNERFVKQNTKIGQNFKKNLNHKNLVGNKGVDQRKLNQTNTEIKDVLIW